MANTVNLTPYERWQLERYGNILPEYGRRPKQIAEEPMQTAEENHIYELENPE